MNKLYFSIFMVEINIFWEDKFNKNNLKEKLLTRTNFKVKNILLIWKMMTNNC